MLKKNIHIAAIIFFLIFNLTTGFISNDIKATGRFSVLKWKNSGTVRTISKGKKFRFQVVTYPDNTRPKVKYKSSNRNIVKVNRFGTIKAIKKGSCRITAITTDGTGKKVTCKVYVGKRVKSIKCRNLSSNGSVFEGEKVKFNLKIAPKDAAYKKLSFETSDRAVAVISKRGVLRAKRHGKVRIKISSKDGSNKKIYKKIKVKARAKSLKLKGTSHTCFVGKTFKIEPVIKLKKAGTKYIRYKSSNKRIATVSVKKGIVKGLRPGVVTITAKMIDGSKLMKKYTLYVEKNPNFKEKLTAHRGASGYAPENTITAFKKAVSMGYGSIETDIHEVEHFYIENENVDVTNFREFVIMHDSNIKRMTGFDLDVTGLDEDNIKVFKIFGGYKIPILQEYINCCKNSSVMLEIELKSNKKGSIIPAGAKQLIETLIDNGVAGRSRIISFNRDSLATVNKAINEIGENNSHTAYNGKVIDGSKAKLIKLGCIIGEKYNNNEEGLRWAMNTPYISLISVKYNHITKAMIAEFKKSNKARLVEAWTVDDAGLAMDMFRLGVDRITTNKLI